MLRGKQPLVNNVPRTENPSLPSVASTNGRVSPCKTGWSDRATSKSPPTLDLARESECHEQGSPVYVRFAIYKFPRRGAGAAGVGVGSSRIDTSPSLPSVEPSCESGTVSVRLRSEAASAADGGRWSCSREPE